MNDPRRLEDDLAPGLASLASPAPATLRPAVLTELGLLDRYATMDSPIGPLVVAWNGLGVVLVDAATDAATFEARHAAATGRPARAAERLPADLAAAIERRLAGDRRARIALDLRGHTAFEQDVWRKALEIPRGEVRPYGWVAAEIGRPRAVRAVGTALGHNPVPLIVPCHRVVRTDGSIGQYSLGGPANKRAILAAEGLDPASLEASAARGERLVGSATTHVVCWPTCRAARRIQPGHRRPFRSVAAARAAGFRPCALCRPVDVAGAAA